MPAVLQKPSTTKIKPIPSHKVQSWKRFIAVVDRKALNGKDGLTWSSKAVAIPQVEGLTARIWVENWTSSTTL